MKYSIEKVYENIEISSGIYKLTIKGVFDCKPGQFYMLRAWEHEPVLWRPISIFDVDEEKISFLYQVVGQGTKILSELKPGDDIKIMGSFGNGFPMEKISGKIAIVTGGIGIAPMKHVMKGLKNCRTDLYSGFRDEIYAVDEMKDYAENVYISTESGKTGHKGYITEILKTEDYDMVLCCGPEIMMNKVINLCSSKNVPVYVSMEKHMACGVGACLVCTCKTTSGNKRTCKDGPVFLGSEVIVND